MPYLFEILLFLTPFALFFAWRRLAPSLAPRPAMLWLTLAGLGCAMVGLAWYGFSLRSQPHEAYRPAELGPDGRVIQGRSAR
ncbi:hypothetical protein JYK14_27110 [Siccirubricoccus sp. KC 17139]|uniref:Cardiolipin synthase N-terminal domain-containing protein n=1 Tax=Siccirubricoccus soli TaxID=2899147 RepID=A0ABT1DCZ3_9PROT|nr:hypothetical protein [Siccirubricoccus soli]MCO6419806.1 hypothetical protein [Siccirubricoccus soli]MCP2685941.1 hypothetical protein [Siccirubricoccus soli]